MGDQPEQSMIVSDAIRILRTETAKLRTRTGDNERANEMAAAVDRMVLEWKAFAVLHAGMAPKRLCACGEPTESQESPWCLSCSWHRRERFELWDPTSRGYVSICPGGTNPSGARARMEDALNGQ